MINVTRESHKEAINIKEVVQILIFGGIGGFLSWVYTVTMGKPIALIWYYAIPASIFLGTGAAFVGVYVIAHSDTRAVMRCLGFALLCGFSWKPIYDAGSALVNQTFQQQEERGIVSLSGKSVKLAQELQKVSTDKLPEKIDEVAKATIQVVEGLPQIKTTNARRQVMTNINGFINAIDGVASKKPREAVMAFKELGEASGKRGETEIANLAVTSLAAFSQDISQPMDIRMEASQFTAEISSFITRDYNIEIYYQKDRINEEKVAKNVESIIKSKNITNRVVLNPQTPEFFKSAGIPLGNEVRYEPGIEDEAAQAVVLVLNSQDPSLNFQLRPVIVSTPSALHVYIRIVSH